MNTETAPSIICLCCMMPVAAALVVYSLCRAAGRASEAEIARIAAIFDEKAARECDECR